MNISSVSQAESTENIAPAASKPLLLVVEDDEDLAHILSIVLRMEGYEVKTVWTVHEATTYLQNNTVNLVITDWMLPDGTGGDVCLATRGTNVSIPVIVISAAVDQWNTDFLKCESDAYLKKPLDMETLRHLTQRMLKSGRVGKRV